MKSFALALLASVAFARYGSHGAYSARAMAYGSSPYRGSGSRGPSHSPRGPSSSPRGPSSYNRGPSSQRSSYSGYSPSGYRPNPYSHAPSHKPAHDPHDDFEKHISIPAPKPAVPYVPTVHKPTYSAPKPSYHKPHHTAHRPHHHSYHGHHAAKPET